MIEPEARYVLLTGGVVLAIGVVAALPFATRICVRLKRKHSLTARLVQTGWLAVLLVASVAFLLGDTFSAFLYAQF